MQSKDFQPLRECPFCGGEVKIDMLDSENSRNVKIYSAVHCPKCHEWFFKGLSKEKTVAAWNRRAQPENKPLTLEELRQMDGEPVWTTGIGANRNKCYWCLVMVERESVFTVVSDEMTQVGAFCQYGKTWLAYRRKPERSEG